MKTPHQAAALIQARWKGIQYREKQQRHLVSAARVATRNTTVFACIHHTVLR
jgi:hypothetical protein